MGHYTPLSVCIIVPPCLHTGLSNGVNVKLSLFDYNLPKELIAQYPLGERDASRLLVVNRANDTLTHQHFSQLPDHLRKGDLLVLNNTKVMPVRLFAQRKSSGGRIEIFLLEKISKRRFRALIKPLKKLRLDEELLIENDHGLSCALVDAEKRIVEFNHDDVLQRIDECGHVPLPHYIKRSDEAIDRERDQTVYAQKEGAVAAPTAGLHFTESLLTILRQKGVNIAFLTLHVGDGTFASIREEDIAKHAMHEERFEIPQSTIALIRQTKDAGGRVIAVGTTACRALESNQDAIFRSAACRGGLKGRTDLFIYPPFSFAVVDALITNFHLPKSSLFILVSALTGMHRLKKIYQHAIEHRYRFFSYGDAMFVF